MTKGFIDFHSNILPGLDESASTIGESLRSLKIAGDDGITDIVATPPFFFNHFIYITV